MSKNRLKELYDKIKKLIYTLSIKDSCVLELKINGFTNDKSLGYKVFYNASLMTASKYGYDQIYGAIKKGLNGNFNSFTGDKEQLAKYVNPNLIEPYCKYYLSSLGISDEDLKRIDPIREFSAQISRTVVIKKQK